MTKLLRSLFKLVVRLRYGRRLGHAYMWLPYLSLTKPTAGQPGEIFYRGKKVGELISSAVLAKSPADRVYVVGSGPSIRTNDLSLIEDRTAILLNGAVSLVGNGLGRPLAVAVEDERFIYRHFDMLRTAIDSDVICLFSVPVLRAICETDGAWLADRTIVLIDNVRKPYGSPRRDAEHLQANPAAITENGASVGFSLDPDWGVFQGGSVVVSTLQFAVHCRPSSIGLLGIDISNANEPRFYESRGEMAKSGVARATERIVSHLLLARKVAQAENAVLLNHSPVSVLRAAGFGYDPHFEKPMDRAGL